MKKYKTTSEAYLAALRDVLENPDFISSPRGMKTYEKMNYGFIVESPTTDVIVTNDEERNKKIASYTRKECELYDAGSNLASEMAKASKFWLKIANPDGTINSNYGFLAFVNKSHGNDFEKELVQISSDCKSGGSVNAYKTKMRTPYEWALESLRRDKDSRQAILRFSLPEHQWMGNKDQTCTLHANFLIRDDQLHMTVNMRSNDLMLGLVYDMPWFISVQERMIEDLKDLYPELKIGTYTHIVNSIHIYDRNVEDVKKMLGDA